MDKENKLRLVYRELDGFDDFGPDLLHSAEGPKHLTCKLLSAYLIQDAGRDVAIEKELESGEVDVLDLGDSDEPARVIELETSCSPQKKREKMEQYAGNSELIGDVHTLPIKEAPDDLNDLLEWLRERIPAV